MQQPMGDAADQQSGDLAVPSRSHDDQVSVTVAGHLGKYVCCPTRNPRRDHQLHLPAALLDLGDLLVDALFHCAFVERDWLGTRSPRHQFTHVHRDNPTIRPG